MISFDFFENQNMQSVSSDFTAIFGGFFALQSPDIALIYVSKDNTNTYIVPEDDTPDILLQTLRDSIESNRNLIVERWSLLKLESDCVY